MTAVRILIQLWAGRPARWRWLFASPVKQFKNGSMYGGRRADDDAQGCQGGVERCKPQPLFQFAPSFWFIYSLFSFACFLRLQLVLLKIQDIFLFLLLCFSPLLGKSCLNYRYMETFGDRHVCLAKLSWKTSFKASESHGKRRECFQTLSVWLSFDLGKVGCVFILLVVDFMWCGTAVYWCGTAFL